MKALMAIFLFCAAQCSWAFSLDADSVSDINSRSAAALSLSHRARAPFYQASDADKYYLQPYSLSDINASYIWRHQEHAAEPWNGAGESRGAFDADAYLRLGKSSVATAGAGYETGMVRDVQWNSTADYAMLYPYVVADSLGGDLHREQYRFFGGFASQAGKFVYGLGAKYRAIHQYRDYDPRPRNMATDLSVSASGSMRIGRHALGLGAGVRFYKQVMDVEYYSQAGANSTQFHFTGLGHTFGRIDGTSYTETRHKGFGYSASASCLPVDRSGFMAQAEFSFLRMNRQIHEFNEAPLTTLRTYSASLRAGWRFGRGSVTHFPYAEAAWQRRRGHEAVVDNGYMGEFQIIDKHEKYHLNALSARAAWLISADKGPWTFEAEPSVGYNIEKEDYVEPYAKLEMTSLSPSLSLQATRNGDRWMLSATLNASARFCLDKDFGISSSHIQKDIYAYERMRFDRAAEQVCSLSPALTLQYRLDGMGALYGRLAYAERLHSHGPDRGFAVTLGWRFF
ncbi:MAG: hypothetical protein NC102_00035 [Clostridium sp.]|nr:hypothetical protein [Clostridium sp.]